MNDNKKKTFGYYLGTFLGAVILACIVACIAAVCISATWKFLVWLWLL